MPDTPTEAPQAPRTSVVIVTRDCMEPLRRCLSALEASNPREAIEIIVVDNGSRDGTAQLDSEFPAADFLRLPKNFGYTKAANIGLRGAKGDFILLIEPVVEVAPDTIARLAARLEQDTELGAVCPVPAHLYTLPLPDQLYADWKGSSLPELSSGDVSKPPLAGYVRDTPLLVRRTFLSGMRFFDQRYGEFGAQLDLCYQLRNAGKKLAVLPDIRVEVNTTASAHTGTVEAADQLNGVVTFTGKYYGFMPAFKIRMGAALSSLFSGRFGLFSGIVGGQKIDGDQPGA